MYATVTHIHTYIHAHTYTLCRICVCVCVCVCGVRLARALQPANCEMNRYPWSNLVAIKHSCAWQTLTIQKWNSVSSCSAWYVCTHACACKAILHTMANSHNFAWRELHETMNNMNLRTIPAGLCSPGFDTLVCCDMTPYKELQQGPEIRVNT